MSKAFKWGCLRCGAENSPKRFVCTKCGKGKQWKRDQIAESRTVVAAATVRRSTQRTPETRTGSALPTSDAAACAAVVASESKATAQSGCRTGRARAARSLTDCRQLSLKLG